MDGDLFSIWLAALPEHEAHRGSKGVGIQGGICPHPKELTVQVVGQAADADPWRQAAMTGQGSLVAAAAMPRPSSHHARVGIAVLRRAESSITIALA